MKRLGKIKKTMRGFDLIEFVDDTKVPCSIQVSSHEGVWIGVNRYDPAVTGSNIRAHFTARQVKALIGHLQTWIETGFFK